VNFEKFQKKLDENISTVYSSQISPEEMEGRNLTVWLAYQQIQTNKRLVWATWSLAIATIILIIISLFLR